MSKRTPNKTDKLAAVLLMLKRGENWLIPEPTRSKGTAKEICACVEWHHTTEWWLTKETKPQALTPLSPADHAEVTRKVTIPTAAKLKRGIKKRVGKKKRSRPIPGSKGTRYQKKMSGEVVLR